MLITFKSPAGGDVSMFENNAKVLLGILGKSPDDHQGAVTADQLPGAIDALLSAIAADKANPAQPPSDDDEAPNLPDGGINLVQRALPLLELLQRSLKEKVAVTWGV
jgi:hypothetical protein